MLQKLCCISTDSCKFSCFGSSRNQNIKATYLVIILLVFIISVLKNSSPSPSHEQLQQYHCQSIPPQYHIYLPYFPIFQTPIFMYLTKKLTIDLFSLSMFHLIILLFMLPKNKHVKVINQGLWIVKIILLGVMMSVMDFICGTVVIEVLEYAAVFGSGVLYLIMNIIFIDFTYYLELKINQKSQRNSKLHILKIIMSILLVITSIVANVFSYWHNQLYVSIGGSIMIALFFILTFLRIQKNNSLFVYGLNMLHMSLIAYSIDTQQPSKLQQQITTTQQYYIIFFTTLTLTCMLSPGSNQLRTRKSTLNQLLALNTSQNQQTNRYVSSNKWLVYHFVMIIIVFFIPVVTKYEEQAMEDELGKYLDLGKVVWWGTAALGYLWSILVQKIYPEQDLGELENYFKEFQLN